MTTNKKPPNGLVETMTVDTLCNVVHSLVFVNDYFMQTSEGEMPPEQEVYYGLGRHLDQAIAALRYEKKKLSLKLKSTSKQHRARVAERALRALKNPVMENNDKHTPVKLVGLVQDAFADLQNAQLEYYRAVELSDKEAVIRDKELPVFTSWMVERSDHILHAIKCLGDEIAKQRGIEDDEDYDKSAGLGGN